MTITSTVKGLRQLDDSLRQFPMRVQRREAGNATRSGARVIRTGIARRAPEGPTGLLSRGVVVRARRGFVGWAVIGFTTDVSWRVHFVEFGTRFAAARPFVRPALQALKRSAVAKMAQTLGRGIQRQAAKLRQEKGKPR